MPISVPVQQFLMYLPLFFYCIILISDAGIVLKALCFNAEAYRQGENTQNSWRNWMVMMLYKELQLNGCSKCYNRISRFLQCTPLKLWHIVIICFPCQLLMDLEIQDLIYKFYKPCSQSDMQIEKKVAHILRSLTHLAVGKTISWLGKKAWTKENPPTWLAQPWAGCPLTESSYNTVFSAWEKTRTYYFRPSRIWTPVSVKRPYQCLLEE